MRASLHQGHRRVKCDDFNTWCLQLSTTRCHHYW